MATDVCCSGPTTSRTFSSYTGSPRFSRIRCTRPLSKLGPEIDMLRVARHGDHATRRQAGTGLKASRNC